MLKSEVTETFRVANVSISDEISIIATQFQTSSRSQTLEPFLNSIESMSKYTLESLNQFTQNRWVHVAVGGAIVLALIFLSIGIFIPSDNSIQSLVEASGGSVRVESLSVHTKVDWAIAEPLKYRIVEISLTNSSDARALLPQLRSQYGVQYLDLRDTNVTDQDLRHVASLPNLRTLMLDNTNVTDKGLEHLFNLKKLRRLGTLDTSVTFEGLERLEAVTKLSGPCHTRALQELLKENAIKGPPSWHGDYRDNIYDGLAIKPEIYRHPRFEELVGLIEKLDCTVIAEHRFHRPFTRRFRVSLSSPGIGAIARQTIQNDQICEAISHLSRVTHVYFERVSFTEQALQHISQLKNITNLRLDNDGLRHAESGLKHLATLKELRSLNLRNVQTGDDGLMFLQSCPELTYFMAQGINNASGLRHLADFKKLRSLNIQFEEDVQPSELEFLELNEALIEIVKQCPLRNLYVGKLNLSESVCAEVARSESLGYFGIACPDITEEKLRLLARNPNLKSVDLSGSNLNHSHIKALMAFELTTTIYIRNTALAQEDESVLEQLRERFDVYPRLKD